MKLVDANVLLHAVNTRSPSHMVANGWLLGGLRGSAPVGFAWVALLGFMRVSTMPRVLPRPLSADEALEVVDSWLARPVAHVLHPTLRHLDVLGRLMQPTGAGGDLTTDAHLAALALEHRATVVTFDRDFARFPGLRWETPA